MSDILGSGNWIIYKSGVSVTPNKSVMKYRSKPFEYNSYDQYKKVQLLKKGNRESWSIQIYASYESDFQTIHDNLRAMRGQIVYFKPHDDKPLNLHSCFFEVYHKEKDQVEYLQVDLTKTELVLSVVPVGFIACNQFIDPHPVNADGVGFIATNQPFE